MTSSTSNIRKIVLDKFGLRQFNKTNTCYINYDTKEFESKINEIYVNSLKDKKSILKEGYAPFCKHIIVDNFIDNLRPISIKIDNDTKNFIKTAYEARTSKELPVLKRFINFEDIEKFNKHCFNDNDKILIKPAKYLDVILYSKEQITKENESMENEDDNKDIDYDYGIISIKAQDVDNELPMDPITMMRNALGTEEGGSGIKLEKDKYKESVDYWKDNVLIKYN